MDLTQLARLLETHDRVQIIGPSGSGLTRLTEHIHEHWPHAGVVGQDASAHVTYLRDTVIEEVAVGLEQRGVARAEMQARCERILRRVGLTHLAERNPATLSGGETRRLAIATVAVLEPELLVLDLPFAGLDVASASMVLELLAHSRAVITGYQPRDIDAVSISLADAPPTALPAPVAAGERIELGDVTAARSAPRRKWWHFRERTGEGFRVGPVPLAPRRGGVVWLRGANGSGKTTLLRALAGLDGNPARIDASLALQRAADQVVETTVAEFAGGDSQTHPLDLPQAELRLAQLRQVFEQGRELVLLDEPDTSLDPRGRTAAHAQIAAGLRAGQAVILTCHDEGFVGEVAAYAEVESVVLDG
ncbi:ATP-binding cassette domain-containing protein [Corynebacterium sp. p3-SID1056]|uniref:ATP-binding cassette domain-containing protein n=1 Tax=Corynebacterium sp. p3-SID1056 TaxID=2916092 RepID=UPI0021A65E2B|nr:ATP-binding cassette domain-containing protein [Corynebacterium sp. p3-SID1056]MCT2339810.1 ATP-binding cassette domain-containing protein [Corynebacterium sp. p3-SID1056]